MAAANSSRWPGLEAHFERSPHPFLQEQMIALAGNRLDAAEAHRCCLARPAALQAPAMLTHGQRVRHRKRRPIRQLERRDQLGVLAERLGDREGQEPDGLRRDSQGHGPHGRQLEAEVWRPVVSPEMAKDSLHKSDPA